MNQTKKRESRFHALDVALESVAALAPLVGKIGRRDVDLARQIRRAASSVPLNIGEGSRRSGGDRPHHFRIAAGSAHEVRAALAVAQAWGYVAAAETGTALELLDRVNAMLYRLIHN